MPRFFLPRHGRTHLPGGADPIPAYDATEWLHLSSSGAGEVTAMAAEINPTTPATNIMEWYTEENSGDNSWYTLCYGYDGGGVPIPDATAPWNIVVLDAGVYVLEADLHLYESGANRSFAALINVDGSIVTGGATTIDLTRAVDATVTTGFGNYAYYWRFLMHKLAVIPAENAFEDRQVLVTVFHNKATAFTLGSTSPGWRFFIYRLG